jgi:signal transduction histidine kinase
MAVAAETELLHGTAARDRLHATIATAMREIGDHADAARTLAGSDELAARAAIAAIRACSTDALGSVRALVALLPAASGRTLADDVHDTLGHALSLATLLAGGAAARLANDPALAREALGQLSTLCTETVAELERLLGAQATPFAADIALLTSLARDQPVTFDVDGDALSAAPLEVAAAVYRIVRESLTNARKHTAGGPVHVRVATEAETLTVVVVSAPSHRRSAPGSGRGIPGMRRRARAVGGKLVAGPTRDGGFHVTARLPR